MATEPQPIPATNERLPDLRSRHRVATVTRIVLGLLVTLSIANGVEQAATHLAAVRRTELAFGILKSVVSVTGAIALWRLLRTPRTALRWLLPWAGLVAILAGMAPVVFGRAPLTTGALSFGASLLALGACLLWWRRVG